MTKDRPIKDYVPAGGGGTDLGIIFDLMGEQPAGCMTVVQITDDDLTVQDAHGREAAEEDARDLIRAISEGRAECIDKSGSI